ncbi:MAG TPA: M48 family metalloprotease, partial [Candidatus Limnocylindria bacterium]|nr:M48 family metalloprotease [Candidatus Limnocylindria bacterium]
FWWRSEGHPTGLFAGLFIALGTLAFAILHSFTVSSPPPRGVKLARGDAPELFDLIDELQTALKVAPIDEVILVADTHAGCEQRLRFGLFGPTRRYILLGMPSLLAVSSGELRAILAHELGHLSRDGGATRAWAYGVRESWVRFLVTLNERRSLTAGLFARIFGKYMSYFARYSFVLARQQEVSADRAAAALCGRAVVADSLVRLSLLDRVVDRAIGMTSGITAFQGSGPAAQTRQSLRAPNDPDQLRRDLNAVLASEPATGDVHPPLGERLAALGVAPRPPSPTERSAADRYFGARVDELCAQVDEAWRMSWHEGAIAVVAAVKDQVATSTAELEQLAKTPIDESSLDELRRRAQLTEWLHGAIAAEPLYEALAARDAPVGHLGVGRIRLAKGDISGLASLDHVIELGGELGIEAASEAHEFLVAQGDTEKAERYREILAKNAAEMGEVLGARGALRTEDELVAHDLAAELVGDLTKTFVRVSPVSRAYLVKKVVADRPELRAYFLAVVYRTVWFFGHEQHEVDALTSRLQEAITSISDEITVVCVNRYAGRKKIESVDGSLVYVRRPEAVGREVLPRWGRRAQTLDLVLAVPYTLMYIYLVANLAPGLNPIAGPIVVAPLIAIVAVLFWARRGDDTNRRIGGLVGVGALVGMVAGAYVTEGEWTFMLTPVLALGLLRPPANAPRILAALVVAAAALAGLAVRLFAHLVLVG